MGPTSDSQNITYMWDSWGDAEKKTSTHCDRDSLANFISNNPRCTKFAKLLNDANLYNEYNSSLTNYTVLIPTDNSILNSSIYDSRELIKTYTLPVIIPFELLAQNMGAYYNTKNGSEKLFIEYNNGEVYVDRQFRIVDANIQTANGMIHLISSTNT
jgi:uncharacterized surface protein with fasciclin (FAS1) repeats